MAEDRGKIMNAKRVNLIKLACSVLIMVCTYSTAVIAADSTTAEKGNNYLERAERELGTHSDLDRSFHVIVDEPQGFGLRFPGIVIGIEKTSRNTLQVPKLSDDPNLIAKPEGFSKKNLKGYRARLNDRKRTFISHIVESDLDLGLGVPYLRNRFLYDAYEPYDHGAVNEDNGGRRPSSPVFELPPGDLYATSWKALKALSKHLEEQLLAANEAGKPYSHVIVASMGWNTAQEKALRNINSLFGNLLIAGEGDPDFKPLYIAITWPSEWRLSLGLGFLSFLNKPNDADEIGFVWANALLNKHLAGLRARSSANTWPAFRIVAMGHSLGARLYTRAAFSGAALKPPVPLRDGVDLVIGLQGAFSANRFLSERKEGMEGAPYADYAQLRGRVVLTWSEHDTANTKTNYLTGANYVGAKTGFNRAEEYKQHFEFVNVLPDGAIGQSTAVPGGSKQVVMMDASELIKYTVLGTGGNAHSDIYNAYMGKLIYEVIRRYAESEPQP